MRNCRKCNNEIPNSILINGIKKRLSKKRYFCLDCSPFGQHNCKDLSNPLIATRDEIGNLIKKCSNCLETKLAEDFYSKSLKRDGPLSVYCKKCWIQISVNKQRQKKLEMIEYKGGKCEKCGYDKCPAAFDFHHLDLNQKRFQFV